MVYYECGGDGVAAVVSLTAHVDVYLIISSSALVLTDVGCVFYIRVETYKQVGLLLNEECSFLCTA